MSEPPTFPEILAQLPRAAKISSVEEWRSRSGFTRVLYPLWVAESVLVWSCLLTMAAFLCFLVWALKPLGSTSADTEGEET